MSAVAAAAAPGTGPRPASPWTGALPAGAGRPVRQPAGALAQPPQLPPGASALPTPPPPRHPRTSQARLLQQLSEVLLEDWRSYMASTRGLRSVTHIMGSTAITRICQDRPAGLEQLREYVSMADSLFSVYGPQILQVGAGAGGAGTRARLRRARGCCCSGWWCMRRMRQARLRRLWRP